jgi:hypothetical protein
MFHPGGNSISEDQVAEGRGGVVPGIPRVMETIIGFPKEYPLQFFREKLPYTAYSRHRHRQP